MRSLTASINAAIAVLVVLIAAGCSPETIHGSFHGRAVRPPDVSSNSGASQSATYRIADDGSAWKRSPHMHAFYDTTVATFANGTNIDVDAYEARSFAIFREFARANGVSEEAMLDHLKLIPRQVVGIVKENPAVLKSYDDFWVAMVGPD
jgi:hypothetical protein